MPPDQRRLPGSDAEVGPLADGGAPSGEYGLRSEGDRGFARAAGSGVQEERRAANFGGGDRAERIVRDCMSLNRRGGFGKLMPRLAAVVFVVALGGVAALRTGVLDAQFGEEEAAPHEFASVAYQPAESVADFVLTRHDGEAFRLSDLEGDVVAIYFGYTHCPDICPLTLNNLARAKALLPEELRDDFQVVMLTADPARDTAEVLANYVPFFDPKFIGVTGSEAAIAEVLQEWHVYVEYGEPDEYGAYLVGHPAFTLLLDRNGDKVLKISQLLTTEQIASDIEAVLEAS